MKRRWTAADLSQNKALPPQPGLPSGASGQVKKKNAATGLKLPKSTANQITTAAGKVLIGIDPGSVVTGVAVIAPNEPILLCGFKSHCEAIIEVLSLVKLYGSQNVHIVIEDARAAPKNAYFAKKNGHGKDQGAGYVKALSKDWQMFCERVAKVPCTLKAPNPARTKWPPEYFEQITGIKTLKGEHHLRDAFLLIYQF